MNTTTYFYPKVLEFQIICHGPQLMPSRAACGPRATSLRPLLYSVLDCAVPVLCHPCTPVSKLQCYMTLDWTVTSVTYRHCLPIHMVHTVHWTGVSHSWSTVMLSCYSH